MNFATHIQISKSCHYLDLYPKHTKSRNRGHCYGRRKVEGRKTWSYEICLCGNLSKNDAPCQALDVLSSAWHGCNQLIFCMYVMRSARSCAFLMPAKTILVPGMYFFGLTKYSNMCLSDHVMPDALLASEYAKPSVVPEAFPKTPQRGGPCLALPPSSIVWHW